MTNTPSFATYREDGRKFVIFDERETIDTNGEWVHQYGVAVAGSRYAKMGLTMIWIDSSKVDIQ